MHCTQLNSKRSSTATASTIPNRTKSCCIRQMDRSNDIQEYDMVYVCNVESTYNCEAILYS